MDFDFFDFVGGGGGGGLNSKKMIGVILVFFMQTKMFLCNNDYLLTM